MDIAKQNGLCKLILSSVQQQNFFLEFVYSIIVFAHLK